MKGPWLRCLAILVLVRDTDAFTVVPPEKRRRPYRLIMQRQRKPCHGRHLHLSSDQDDAVLTSILLQVSYDGSRFSGWSAGNHDVSGNNSNKDKRQITHPPRSSRRRRNRHLYSADAHGIRSVQGVLQLALAKVYGNVNPRRVVVEGASRTDKGVHAMGMVAHVYCLTEDAGAVAAEIRHDENNNRTISWSSSSSSLIPGKALPHPRNGTDTTCFLPLPKTMTKLGFTLNRMLPPDVRILRVAKVPSSTMATHHGGGSINNTNTNNNSSQAATTFHASTSATAKTYVYRVATGPRPDPTQLRTTWHVDNSNSNNRNNQQPPLNVTAMKSVATIWTQRAYNFGAFAGAPRGADDRQKRAKANYNTTCRLYDIDIDPEYECVYDRDDKDDLIWHGNEEHCVYTITITGNRFLYKMMRFLVGTLVGVGQGCLSLEDVQTMLATGRRVQEGISVECAPAHGLVLEKVHYDDCPDLEWQLANS